MSAMSSQITSLTVVFSTIYPVVSRAKHGVSLELYEYFCYDDNGNTNWFIIAVVIMLEFPYWGILLTWKHVLCW